MTTLYEYDGPIVEHKRLAQMEGLATRRLSEKITESPVAVGDPFHNPGAGKTSTQKALPHRRALSRSSKPVAPVTQNARPIPVCDNLKSARASWRFTFAPGNLDPKVTQELVALDAARLEH